MRLATGSGETIFRRIDSPVLSGEGVSLGNYEDGKVNCASVDSGSQGTAKVTFSSRSSQQVYVYVETAGAESITARRENEELVQLTEDCGAIVSLGECEAGERIIIDIQYETGQAGDITAYACGMDMDAWDRAYALLDDETLQVDAYSDTEISGTIQVKENGFFVTSIPYEKGWTLEVDGEKVETETFGGAFLAAHLSAGEHEICLTYLPDGFIPGILVSLCGIGILVALCFVRKRQNGDADNHLCQSLIHSIEVGFDGIEGRSDSRSGHDRQQG